MPAVVVRSLRQHRQRQIEEKLFAGSRWVETGLVFTTPIGRRSTTATSHARFSGY
jgi:hypothetical protein